MQRVNRDVIGHDIILTKRRAHTLSEEIIARLGYKNHTIAIAGRSNGLVSTLTTGIHQELATQNSLSTSGQVRGLDNHIGVRAAYDYNVFHYIISNAISIILVNAV